MKISLLHSVLLGAVILFSGLLLALPAHAQISTDRPDFADSPNTLSTGSIQLETGLTMEFYGDDMVRAIGEPLIRYGLPSSLEVRLGLPSHIGGDVSESGLSDPSVGVKWTISDFAEDGSFGVIGSLLVPLGDDQFTSDGFDPSIALIASKPLNQRLSLAAQILGAWATAGDDRHLNWTGTVVMGTPIGETMGAFAEIRADAPEIGEERYLAHFGLLKSLNDRIQVDIHGGFGLSDSAPDSFLGFGVAYGR